MNTVSENFNHSLDPIRRMFLHELPLHSDALDSQLDIRFAVLRMTMFEAIDRSVRQWEQQEVDKDERREEKQYQREQRFAHRVSQCFRPTYFPGGYMATSSNPRYYQMIGRGARPEPGYIMHVPVGCGKSNILHAKPGVEMIIIDDFSASMERNLQNMKSIACQEAMMRPKYLTNHDNKMPKDIATWAKQYLKS